MSIMSNVENKENNEKKANKEIMKIMVTGTLTKMRYERGYKGKGEEAWRISIKPNKPISDDVKKEVLNILGIGVDDVFCPKWLKDVKAEYINLHTIFNIPCRVRGTNGSMYEVSMDEVFEGATVKICLKVKAGGIYPSAIQVEKNGVPYNPFEDFEEDD